MRRQPISCSVFGCIAVALKGRKLCSYHQATADGASKAPVKVSRRRKALPKGRYRTKAGYIMLSVKPQYPGARPMGDGGEWRILEHRAVMSQMIGRALFRHENVHHVNGIKDDNRPENLELWIVSQPCGQRVKDQLEWARQIIDMYGGIADKLT